MKVAVKEKVKLSFDKTAIANAIKFFKYVETTVNEAKHAAY